MQHLSLCVTYKQSSKQHNEHKLISKLHFPIILSRLTWSDWFSDCEVIGIVSVLLLGQHPVSMSHPVQEPFRENTNVSLLEW